MILLGFARDVESSEPVLEEVFIWSFLKRSPLDTTEQ